ncbi:MAG: GntR family transcriptional regulator [Thiolinea sp.]
MNSRNPAKPLYQIVEDHITQLINSGSLVHGDLIPAEPKLAQQLGVSQGTVKKAIDNLVWQKRLYRHQGKGTYVSAIDFNNSLFRFTSYGNEQGADARIRKETLARERRVAAEHICQRLNVAQPAEEIYIERVGYVSGEPVLVEYSHWLADKVAGLEDESLHIPDLFYALIVERFQLPIVRAEETLIAGAAGEHTAKRLKIAAGTPVLILKRSTYTVNDQIVEVRTSVGRSDKFSYKTEIR